MTCRICQGLMQPSAIDFRSSGITNFGSTYRSTPNPSHSVQAPKGELKKEESRFNFFYCKT